MVIGLASVSPSTFRALSVVVVVVVVLLLLLLLIVVVVVAMLHILAHTDGCVASF